MSAPGSKFASCSPCRPRPRSSVRTPRTRPSATSSFSAGVSGRIDRAARLGLAGRASGRAARARRRSSRDSSSSAASGSAARSSGQVVDGLVRDLAEEGQLVEALAAGEEPPQPARVDDRAGEQVRPRLLALLEHRDRDVAEPRGGLRILLERAGRGGSRTRARRGRRRRSGSRPRSDRASVGRGERVLDAPGRRVVSRARSPLPRLPCAAPARSASARPGGGRRRRRGR